MRLQYPQLYFKYFKETRREDDPNDRQNHKGNDDCINMLCGKSKGHFLYCIFFLSVLVMITMRCFCIFSNCYDKVRYF